MKKIIIDALNKYYPNPKIELDYKKDYELVISVMLSAQTTDKRVNMVTKELFEKHNSLEKLSKLTIEEIEKNIKSIGIYKNKSKHFKNIVDSLVKIGYVPNDREYLESLPGVGRKTANVILSELYNVPCIAVDTHVDRISKRLALANKEDSVEVIEKKLMEYFPKEEWRKINLQIILFGRYRCTAKNPMCEECLLKSICKYYKEKKDI